VADIVGWVASVIMLIGGAGVAHKKVWGLVYFLVGNLLWAGVGWAAGLYSLVGVSLAFAAMDVYAIWKWILDK